jgi:diguanylate cyclase (GGDEF)-like protein/PAS domain S-box-containing protein
VSGFRFQAGASLFGRCGWFRGARDTCTCSWAVRSPRDPSTPPGPQPICEDVERLEPSARETVLATLMADAAPSLVVAIGDSGFFVPMPLTVVLPDQVTVVTGGATALDLVVPEDAMTIIEAWTHAKAGGTSLAVVHPVDDPEHEATIHFVDMTHRWGVYLCLLVGTRTIAGDHRPALETLQPKVTTVRKDELAKVLAYDDSFTAILGWAPGELIGRRSLEIVHPDDQQRAIAHWIDMITRPGVSRRVRLRHQHRDGSWRWFEVTNTNLVHSPGHGYVSAEMLDISDEMDAVEALRAGEMLLRRLTDALPVGVLQIGVDRRTVYSNSRVHEIIERQVVGADVLLEAVQEQRLLAGVLDQVLGQGEDADLELRLAPVHPSPTGPAGEADETRSPRRVHISLRALVHPGGAPNGAILCISDVTDAARQRELLAHKAAHDALTGCLTRGAILERLGAELQHTAAKVAVLFIDLDGFKQVNDELGHAAGDTLLRHVADVLSAETRPIDHLGRLGGDEFLVVMPGLPSREAVAAAAERLSLAIGRPFDLAGTPHTPRASIGLAWTQAPAVAEDLIAEADASMYTAKSARRPRAAQSAAGRDPAPGRAEPSALVERPDALSRGPQDLLG